MILLSPIRPKNAFAQLVNPECQISVLPDNFPNQYDKISGKFFHTVQISFSVNPNIAVGNYKLNYPFVTDEKGVPRPFQIDENNFIINYSAKITTFDTIYPDPNNKWTITDSNNNVVCELEYEIPPEILNQPCIADKHHVCLDASKPIGCAVKGGDFCCDTDVSCQNLIQVRGEQLLCSNKRTATHNIICDDGKYCTKAEYCDGFRFNLSSPAITAQLLDDIDPIKQLGSADSPDSIGSALTRFLNYFAFPIAGLILFVMLIWGGFEILAQSATKKSIDAGKQRITNALVGFFLLFASYWIAQLIEVIFGVTIL